MDIFIPFPFFCLLFVSSTSSVHLQPVTTSIQFNISRHTPHTINNDGVMYYKLPVFNQTLIGRDLFYMYFASSLVSIMKGVRAFVHGYVANTRTENCAYLDIDYPINSSTHYMSYKNSRLYFRMSSSDIMFYEPTYYLTLNLTLYIRGTPYCTSPATRYNIRWNLEKGFSVFG
eukprot:PhF_6_TR23968/c1_g1_i1/m.33555